MARSYHNKPRRHGIGHEEDSWFTRVERYAVRRALDDARLIDPVELEHGNYEPEPQGRARSRD